MSDPEFEKLDAQAWRYIQRGRRIPFKLAGRLVRCRDCDRAEPEWYMLKNYLWRRAVPSGRGCLCLACLEKRLGRPLVAADFGSNGTLTAAAAAYAEMQLSHNEPALCLMRCAVI